MSISLFNMIGNDKKRPNSFGLMDMFDAVKDKILPIIGDTPYGWATEKVKEHGNRFLMEMGEGLYHDLPQGTIDLGVDIINRGSNLVGGEGDLINRESVQVVPPVFDEEERRKLGMKSLEEDSVGRILGQLFGGYAGLRSVVSKGLLGEATSVAGAGATLDPTKENLSNFMQDTRFNNLLFEYMAAGVPEEASAGERLVARVGTMTEELGLAFIPVGLIQGLRAMKNNPAIKEQLLDTFHPDRIGQLVTDKTGLTTDYRMMAVPEEGGLLPSAKVDSAGFYLKSEQQVLAMPQDKMQASHVAGYLQKRGVSPSEMKDIGLLDMLGKIPTGEMITKQGLLDYIDKNRITMTSESLVPGGADLQFQALHAPDPNDYYMNDRTYEGVVGQPASVGENLWETEKWYNAEGTENQWKIMDDEHHGMRHDEMWDEITGELEVTFDEHGAFQKEKTGDMFTSLQTFEELHKLYPDKYPETTVMRMDKLREAIRSREASSSQSESLKSEILKAQKELDELEANFKWGTEWDADILRALKDGNLDNKILSDMDEAVATRTTKEYMDSPYFEVKVGNDDIGEYIFRGNDDIGWEILDDTGENIFKNDSPSLRSSPSLNEAQVELRQYVEDMGFYDSERYALGNAKYTNPDWIQPNANMDTYSEELVRLEGTPDEIKIDVYDEGHYGDDYPDTIGHFRKTIREGMVVHPDITVPKSTKKKTYEDIKKEVSEGYMVEDDNVYFVEEVQSDWMSAGREFGFGEEANIKGIKDAEFKMKELKAFKTSWRVIQNNLKDYKVMELTGDEHVKKVLELKLLPQDVGEAAGKEVQSWKTSQEYNYQQETISKTDNKILQKAFQQGEVQGFRMEEMGIDKLGYDPNEYSRTIQPHEVRSQKEWNERWKVDPRNPQAENFEGFGIADLDQLDEWFDQELKRLDNYLRRANDVDTPEFTPVKDQDRDVHLMVKHAITKAIENGSTKVAFPKGDMILDIWNKARRETFHKKVEFEELYSNLYDKKIPKFLKKYAGQHKGKVGKIYIEDFGREVFYIEITPEMRESLLKEVTPPYQITDDIDKRGLIHPQSLYAKFPLPIGAGLLGMQEEKKKRGLLD